MFVLYPGQSFVVLFYTGSFFIWETKKWFLIWIDRWQSYTVTVVWKFPWADSALVVLDK